MNEKNGVVDIKKKFKIPSKIKSYKIEKELYKISNAHICVGTNTNINEKVLIKIYDKEIIQYQPQELSLINNEIFMMKLINHKNLLKLYEIIESPSYIFLIMEYFNGTKLVDYINRKKKLSEDDALNIYKQLLSALVYIHDMNIGHLNINSNNILVDNSNNIKICEFKYSIFYSDDDRTKINSLGEPCFLSPELLSRKSCFPDLSDIWSSGVVLYLLTVGELPFYHPNELDLEKIIMRAEFKLPSNMSKNMQEFIKNIFEEKEESRYNFDKIFSSELFKQKKINKNNLANGLNILSAKYPIDERVMNICKTQFNLDPEDIKQKLYDNIFDPYTSLYKQIITKFTNKKIFNAGDLTSKKFNTYINNEKNYLDENTQKNNIKNSLNKELDFKLKNKQKETDINQNQQQALIKLDDILKLFNGNKENPEEDKKRESKSVDTFKKKTELEEKENKEVNMPQATNNISLPNGIKINTTPYVNNKNQNKKSKDSGKRNSIRQRRSNMYDKKLNVLNMNKGRRFSTNVNMDDKLKTSLEKFKLFQLNQLNKKNAKNNKNYLNKNEIIEESKEEYEGKKKKPLHSFKDNNTLKILEESENSKSPSHSKNSSKSKKSSRSNSNEKEYKKIKDIKEDIKIIKKVTFNENNIINKKQSLKQYNSSNKKEKSNESKENLDENQNNSDNKNKILDNSSGKNNNEPKNIVIQHKSSRKFSKDTKNNAKTTPATTSKPSVAQISKEEFFNQIKGVKLRKMTPNKYSDPDEIKKKDPNNSMNDNPIEVTSVSVKGVREMIEEKLKNTKIEHKTKSSNNINKSKQNKNEDKKDKDEKKSKNENDLKFIRKQMENKYNALGLVNNNSNSKGRKNVPRKSVNYDNMLKFKSQAIFLNKSDIKKQKSKDDNSSIKYHMNNSNDVILEEGKNEIATPKFKKKNEKDEKRKKEKNSKIQEDQKNSINEEDIKNKKKEDEEKKRKEEEQKKLKEEDDKKRLEEEDEDRRRKAREEKRLREQEERRKKKEIERKKKEEEDEINRRREQEERIQREIEEEKKRKEIEKKIKEKRDKKHKEMVEKLFKEEEEARERIAERERINKLFEEERRMEEEEERKRKEAEEEALRKKKEDEERRRKKREERERRKREEEEEDKRKEKEEKIRKEKEKERIKREEEEKIKKWKEEKKKKKENEEKKRLAEEERLKQQEEEERLLKQEETERKRMEEQEENKRRLEEYENRQKEELEKRIRKQTIKKQKEEELRQKREKEAKERKNNFLNNKGNHRKMLLIRRPESDSESGSESSEESEKEVKVIKTEGNQPQHPKDKKFNFHANPFDLYKKNDSDEDSSPKVRPKKKSKEFKKIEEPKKKKVYGPKLNDFNKFRESDRNVSESESYESSEEREEEEDNHYNNKNEGKNNLNRSVEDRKKRNEIFDEYTNYFFDEDAINEGQLKNKKNKKLVENKTNVEKLKTKKGFYHYQNNPTKEEKIVVDKRFEVRRKNPGGVVGLKEAKTDRGYINKNGMKGTNFSNNYSKKTFEKKNSTNSKKLKTVSHLNPDKKNNNNSYERDLLQKRMNQGRNKIKINNEKKKNNTMALNNHNLSKNEGVETDINKSKKNINKNNNSVKKDLSKKSNNKLNAKKSKKNIVQNLMYNFDRSLEPSKYCTYVTTTREAKSKDKNNNSTSKSKLKSGTKKKDNKINMDYPLNRSALVNNNNKEYGHKNIYDEKSKSKTSEGKKLKNQTTKDSLKKSKAKKEKSSNKNVTQFDIGDSIDTNENVIKIKKSKNNLALNTKEEELPLYKGEIDYNNVSIKSIPESIDDLMLRYKKKGYTCIKKGVTDFKFNKGPHTRYVQIMRLGNGLLYFNVTK